jgi:hypothetical protein
MIALHKARKSSDREQTALLQAHESLRSEEVAIARATRSAEPLHFPLRHRLYFLVQPLTMFVFAIGSFSDTVAEEQRVNLRVGSLTRLAAEANV